MTNIRPLALLSTRLTLGRLALGGLLWSLALAACGDNLRPAPGDDTGEPPPGPSRAIIVAGDFMPGHPGVLSTLDVEARMIAMNAGPAMAVGNDPLLRHFGNELFVINRADNNLTILDDQTLAFKEQRSTGENSSPQDVAVVGNRLYVATTGSKGVTVLTRGSNDTSVIDLSADDPDGLPDCESVFLVGHDLYVACGLLTNFSANVPGKVYVVDTRTDTVQAARTVTLSTRNPFGMFEQIPMGAPHAGDLAIPSVFFHFTFPDDGEGCIQRITPGAAPTASCIIDNAELGGYASRVAFERAGAASFLWSAVGPTDGSVGNLKVYDLDAQSLWNFNIQGAGQLIGDVAICPSGDLIVVDKTRNANGLRIYQNATERTTQPMPIGLGSFSSHGLECY
jgi:hypothetical protein